jgi:hypothetical protein
VKNHPPSSGHAPLRCFATGGPVRLSFNEVGSNRKSMIHLPLVSYMGDSPNIQNHSVAAGTCPPWAEKRARGPVPVASPHTVRKLRYTARSGTGRGARPCTAVPDFIALTQAINYNLNFSPGLFIITILNLRRDYDEKYG